MKQKKSIIICSLVWEFLRYIFIFLFTVNFFIIRVNEDSQGIYWLLSISSSNLLLPLILIILLINNNTILLKLLYIGKILQFFPLFMLIFAEIFYGNIFDTYIIQDIISKNLGLVVTFLLIDLIFLSLLLSYNVKEKKILKENNLPDISSIQITDVSGLNKVDRADIES